MEKTADQRRGLGIIGNTLMVTAFVGAVVAGSLVRMIIDDRQDAQNSIKDRVGIEQINTEISKAIDSGKIDTAREKIIILSRSDGLCSVKAESYTCRSTNVLSAAEYFLRLDDLPNVDKGWAVLMDGADYKDAAKLSRETIEYLIKKQTGKK